MVSNDAPGEFCNRLDRLCDTGPRDGDAGWALGISPIAPAHSVNLFRVLVSPLVEHALARRSDSGWLRRGLRSDVATSRDAAAPAASRSHRLACRPARSRSVLDAALGKPAPAAQHHARRWLPQVAAWRRAAIAREVLCPHATLPPVPRSLRPPSEVPPDRVRGRCSRAPCPPGRPRGPGPDRRRSLRRARGEGQARQLGGLRHGGALTGS
jgi:hypothetical protein